ncbi:MAG TPA: winged helix-turn-helix transcriptional regulator [Firmicutes bacterium]|nr:winged helix-turn-helix transcriptional regulator [Bacillota bacterium]
MARPPVFFKKSDLHTASSIPHSAPFVNGPDRRKCTAICGAYAASPRVVYSMSDLGNTLRPIIDAMQDWGTEHKNLYR